MIKTQKKHTPLTNQLAGLHHLEREILVKQWQALYGSAPPSGISQSLMMQAIAYRLQEQSLGGIKSSTQRFLIKAAENASTGTQISFPALTIKPGTKLLREWHGVTHEVIIAERGVQFQGKRYRSLSEVACIITGARWSGPLFFGLKKAAA